MAVARKTLSGGRWRERVQRSLARDSTGLTVLALLVGAGAGAGAVGFRYMILGFTYLFCGWVTTAPLDTRSTRYCRAWASGSS